jgi:hypothetical protein
LHSSFGSCNFDSLWKTHALVHALSTRNHTITNYYTNIIHKSITRLWLVDFSAVNPKQQCKLCACNHSAIFCNHYEPIKIELRFGGKN